MPREYLGNGPKFVERERRKRERLREEMAAKGHEPS